MNSKLPPQGARAFFIAPAQGNEKSLLSLRPLLARLNRGPQLTGRRLTGQASGVFNWVPLAKRARSKNISGLAYT